MANPITMKDILALSPAERIQLVEDIWDSLAEFPEAITLTEAQRQLLDERLSYWTNASKLTEPIPKPAHLGQK
jgi:putative addiction module component (TIGR02574 family)